MAQAPTTTNAVTAQSSKRQLDPNRPLPDSLVSKEKVTKALTETTGLSAEQTRYFRKPMPIEIMLSNAVSKAVVAYLSRIDLAKVHKGKIPTFKELLAVKDLTISVRRWQKGTHQVVAVMAHEEVARQMRDLYIDLTSTAKGAAEYYAFLPLLNPNGNPAKAVLAEVVTNLHVVFDPAAKPIKVTPEWVGEDESNLSLEPPPAAKK